jgi:hypothetical protein
MPRFPSLWRKRRWEKGEEVELNVSGKIIQGDLDAEEWQELSLNSVLVSIHASFA